MSTFMIEPGARLAGRYRLDELVSETGGATLWKATDETLARLVAVWTFAEGFPRTAEVVRAARATSRVADSRVTQVFDADDSGPTAYVVEEWVVGQSLTDLLAQGPLEPDRAAGLVAEAAETLATAHATGLYHLHLTPGKLMWSVGGAVKVTGIGVDAALHGITSPDPACHDAQGLGKLLYAALTAHWPDGPQSGLRPAPVVSGRPCQPSQIRAGVPERLNEIVCRAAFQTPMRGGPLTSAREIADALADVPRLVPLPLAPHTPTAPEPEKGTSRHTGEFGAQAAPPAPPSRRAYRSSDHQGGSGVGSSRLIRVLIGVIGALVFAAVVILAWNIGSSMSGDGDGAVPSDDGGTAAEEPEELAVLEPAGADGFDPDPGDGEEHGDRAPNAIDGDPATAWNTQTYQGPDFGNLKSGVGLILDMGDPAEVHEATLNLGSGSHDLEILVGDAADMSQLESVAAESGVSGEIDVKLADPAEGRYVVIWFTDVPQDGDGYRGTINEVELRGKT
ncbi:protein kinase family protein [Nocardiopsis mangrovi]|uniref:Protein kinase family protein n=1 Tax=Nocardiopsis mangrovi TaxID=1179818 RepID=A0ABV9DZR0_9ACTN